MRHIYYSLFTVFSGMLATNVAAHEMKVFASRQAVPKAGAKSTIFLAWGHRDPVDDLINASMLGRYELISPTGEKMTLKAEGTSLQANPVRLGSAGVYQAIVDRKPSIYTYVIDDEGQRQLTRGGKSTVTEGKIDIATRSVMCGKALLLVGKPTQEVPKAIGQAIEIVPLTSPTKWKANSDIQFRLLINGKPVTTEFPILTARPIGYRPGNAWSYATTVGRKGEFTVRPEKAGTWVLKVNVKRKADQKFVKEYDVVSFTGTLTLEVGP